MFDTCAASAVSVVDASATSARTGTPPRKELRGHGKNSDASAAGAAIRRSNDPAAAEPGYGRSCLPLRTLQAVARTSDQRSRQALRGVRSRQALQQGSTRSPDVCRPQGRAARRWRSIRSVQWPMSLWLAPHTQDGTGPGAKDGTLGGGVLILRNSKPCKRTHDTDGFFCCRRDFGRMTNLGPGPLCGPRAIPRSPIVASVRDENFTPTRFGRRSISAVPLQIGLWWVRPRFDRQALFEHYLQVTL
jgi:hypothetical protein